METRCQDRPRSQTRRGFHLTHRQCVGLVMVCTLLAAAGQMFIKTGASQLTSISPWEMVHTAPLVGGYSLYGLATVLFVLALRDGELSVLYPLISMTYVWVTFLSVWLLGEGLNFFKLAGVGLIVLGVTLLGRGGQSSL